MPEAARLPEGKPRTNFEPGMVFTLDHLKKDDLQFDIDAEVARVKKETELKTPKMSRKVERPKDFEPKLR